jgi:hypothetical protein
MTKVVIHKSHKDLGAGFFSAIFLAFGVAILITPEKLFIASDGDVGLFNEKGLFSYYVVFDGKCLLVYQEKSSIDNSCCHGSNVLLDYSRSAESDIACFGSYPCMVISKIDQFQSNLLFNISFCCSTIFYPRTSFG